MVHFFQIFVSAVCGLAALMNSFLIPIIIYSSSHHFGVYKFLMLALTTIGLFCAILAILTIPLTLTTYNGILYFSSVSYFSKTIDDILLCSYVATYICWSLILLYSFMYRTLAVRQKEHFLFNIYGYIFLGTLVLFLWVIFAKLIYSFPAGKEIMYKLRDRVFNLTGVEVTELACYCGVFFEENGQFGAGFYTSVTVASYAIPLAGTLILCVYLFYSYVTRNAVFNYLSVITQNRQKRLFLHLIAQTITPLCFTTAPILMCYMTSFLYLNLSDTFYFVLAAMIPTAHVMDPLLMLIFIQEYRIIPFEFAKYFLFGYNDRVHKISLNKTQQVLGAYKNLLLVYTCIGFFSSLSLTVVMPTSRGLLFFNTVQRLPQDAATVAIYTFSVSFVMWAVILTYSFLYRCLAVRNKEKLLFNRRGWTTMIILAVGIATFFTFICWNFGPSDETLDLLASRVYNITGRDVHTLSFVGGEFFNEDGSLGNGFYHCATHVGFVLICCITMGCCTCNFYSWLWKKKNRKIGSESTRLQQKKLFTLLILQTVTPLVFSFGPALAVTALTFFSIDVTDAVNYVLSFMLMITQLLDPLWIFYFITDYRRALFPDWKQQSRETVYVAEQSTSLSHGK